MVRWFVLGLLLVFVVRFFCVCCGCGVLCVCWCFVVWGFVFCWAVWLGCFVFCCLFFVGLLYLVFLDACFSVVLFCSAFGFI